MQKSIQCTLCITSLNYYIIYIKCYTLVSTGLPPVLILNIDENKYTNKSYVIEIYSYINTYVRMSINSAKQSYNCTAHTTAV